MARSEEDCLAHMLAAARRAISLTERREREDLDGDIPWSAMTATRDRLIHGYFAVDLDIVWQIVEHDLPPVVAALNEMVPPEANGNG